MTQSGPPIIEVVDVSKAFVLPSGTWGSIRRRPPETLKAVHRVSLDVFKGETLGIVGESGCGKSTLARLMVNLLAPDRGRILFRGEDLSIAPRAASRASRTRLQMVFQDPYSSLNPRMAVGDMVAEPLIVHGVVPRREVQRERDRLMEMVGLSARIVDRLPRELSGGQRQRVSIARALAIRPEVLIADEAVSSLDVSVRAQILNLLNDLKSDLRLTLVFISHDLSVVDYLSDRVGVMYLGHLVELGPVTGMFTGGAHPYTRGLAGAIPRPVVGSRRTQPSIRGEPPNPVHPPSGCVFRTRCPIAVGMCSEVQPPPVVVSPGHWAACHFAPPQVAAPGLGSNGLDAALPQ